MNDERSRTRSELWMARHLQQAARLEQPPFSEALHKRFMEAVRPVVVDTTAAEPMHAKQAVSVNARNNASRRRARWLAAAWMTSAATLLAMAFTARWFTSMEDRSDPTQQQPEVVQSAAVQPANQAVATGHSQPANPSLADAESDDIASAAANYTLDDLSHDAQATAHVLVDQLPFETPTDEWGL